MIAKIEKRMKELEHRSKHTSYYLPHDKLRCRACLEQDGIRFAIREMVEEVEQNYLVHHQNVKGNDLGDTINIGKRDWLSLKERLNKIIGDGKNV